MCVDALQSCGSGFRSRGARTSWAHTPDLLVACRYITQKRLRASSFPGIAPCDNSGRQPCKPPRPHHPEQEAHCRCASESAGGRRFLRQSSRACWGKAKNPPARSPCPNGFARLCGSGCRSLYLAGGRPVPECARSGPYDGRKPSAARPGWGPCSPRCITKSARPRPSRLGPTRGLRVMTSNEPPSGDDT